MLCINCSNQPPKWLHPSRPVIPFDQVAKQISILFALAMMFPILFMNDLLVPPVQDMLVLPSTFPGMFVPAKGVPWGFGTCTGCCSLSCPEKQHWLYGDRNLPLDFFPTHLPSNSGSFIWIKPPSAEKLTESRESCAFARRWQPRAAEMTQELIILDGAFKNAWEGSKKSHPGCLSRSLSCPTATAGHSGSRNALWGWPHPMGRADWDAAGLPQSQGCLWGEVPVLESLEISFHSAL